MNQNLREFIDMVRNEGYTVGDVHGEDQYLIDPLGDAVETWRDKYPYDTLLGRDRYEAEKRQLQIELLKFQYSAQDNGTKHIILFEGRDAAGKGGAIKRFTEHLNPRIARVVALPVPTERERTQWYFQRYIAHLPAAGEICLFDRSWYNRGGVEHVMGYCTPEEHRRFLQQCPVFERMLVDDGILLRKYWFSVSDKEQYKRFKSRLTDPMRRWKLSPTDLESVTRWEDYSRAKDDMFVHTDIESARWHVVESEDKRKARINVIHHMLNAIPYHHVERPPMKFPKKPSSTGYRRTDRTLQSEVPDYAATLSAGKAPDRYVDVEDEGVVLAQASHESALVLGHRQAHRRDAAHAAGVGGVRRARVDGEVRHEEGQVLVGGEEDSVAGCGPPCPCDEDRVPGRRRSERGRRSGTGRRRAGGR